MVMGEVPPPDAATTCRPTVLATIAVADPPSKVPLPPPHTVVLPMAPEVPFRYPEAVPSPARVEQPSTASSEAGSKRVA